MWDLAAGLVLVACLSLVCFLIGISIAHRCSAVVANCTVFGTSLVVLLYGLLLHGRLLLARLLPASNVIIVSNLFPLGAAALAGIVAGRRAIPRWRRTAIGLILAVLGWYTVFSDLAGSRPTIAAPRYHRGLCMQTTGTSCSACCAATLLREEGIPASEAEMVDLCLTREHGTPTLGLYRGLKLKTGGTPWKVEVFRCGLEELREANRWPVILLVDLLTSSESKSSETAWRGWSLRVEHAVVFYGVAQSGEAILGDPAIGKKRWPLAMLERVWNGEGLRLAERGRRRGTTTR